MSKKDVTGALDLLAEQNLWTRCIEKAKQHNSTILHKYVARYAAYLIQNDDSVVALQLYLQHGAPLLPQNYRIYRTIAMGCFALHETEAQHIWKDLRNFLFQLTQSLRTESDDANETTFDHFEKLLLIAHYYTTRAACREIPSLQSIAVRISVAILRYTEFIPIDKAFFEAGMDLRTMNRDSEAFVILNHYLDVCEAIDDKNPNLIDQSVFEFTDFPHSVPIPNRMHLHNDLKLHEELREWILAISMDQKVNQVSSFISH